MKALLTAALLCLLAGAAPRMAAADTIVVASKIDTEGALLGNMIAALLASHGFTVESRIELGPTNILRAAILAGQIDIYPEYTGNGARFFKREGDPAWKDAARGYELVKSLDRARNDLIWLAPAPADNSWVIAVGKDLAAAEQGTRLEDFARYVRAGGKVRLAASAEFVNSKGGLPSFAAVYGFKLRQSQLLSLAGGDTSATIRAAAEGISGVNAAMAYGTDGALSALGLIALSDDKGAQIVYQPAPVVRAAIIERHPELPAILDPVFASLSLTALQRLNASIAVDGIDAKIAARQYLRAKGFLE
jgi:osmoprotectant transport system substrate-binding protein